MEPAPPGWTDLGLRSTSCPPAECGDTFPRLWVEQAAISNPPVARNGLMAVPACSGKLSVVIVDRKAVQKGKPTSELVEIDSSVMVLVGMQEERFCLILAVTVRRFEHGTCSLATDEVTRCDESCTRKIAKRIKGRQLLRRKRSVDTARSQSHPTFPIHRRRLPSTLPEPEPNKVCWHLVVLVLLHVSYRDTCCFVAFSPAKYSGGSRGL